MVKYLILLRGINVGGNNIIKMSDLKFILETSGFQNVKTYIQSGNVILESEELEKDFLVKQIESILSLKFGYESKVVVRTKNELNQIFENMPKWFGKDTLYRHNILFVKEPITAEDALRECGEPKEGLEVAFAKNGVIYVSSSIEFATKTNFIKLPSKSIYKDITIRNFNTFKKLVELINE